MIVPVTCETAASSRLEDPFEMLTHIATGDLKDEAGRRQSAVSASVAVSKIGSVRVAECRGLEAEPLSVRMQRFFDERPVCKTVAFGRRHLRDEGRAFIAPDARQSIRRGSCCAPVQDDDDRRGRP